MTFIKIFLTAGILGPVVTMIIGFSPVLQVWILYYLGLSENNSALNSLFILNLFVYAFTEEAVKYFSAIFWWGRKYKEISKQLLLYIIASAAGLAVFEKTLVIILKIKNGSLERIPWMATSSLFLEAILLHSLIAVLLYPFIKTAETKKNRLYFYFGLIAVSLIHTLYNYYLIESAI